ILTEAVARGHKVTAICRHPENVPKHPQVETVTADVTDTAALTRAFHGKDAIIHAYAPGRDPYVTAYIAEHGPSGIASYTPADPAKHQATVEQRIAAQTAGTRSIIQAAKSAGRIRILAVGGAGTLLVDGMRSIDRPDFPKA